jgi:non-specific serine/threonine protein kinase/serine/threonine-protein kinase
MIDAEKVAFLFAIASELPSADVPAFLARECHGQPELLARLKTLLGSQSRAEEAGFLHQSAVHEVARQTALEKPRVSRTGESFGRYRILRLLGEGGMGEVYLAEDTELNRKVALKLIKSSLGTNGLLDSFGREGRILAHLNHENIARLHDAGNSAAGVPFLVMEYVDGKPITEYCDRTGRSVSQRLELFRVICSAVQYAHQNVVVHRDLKPGNILVTAEGHVKLLDFGIAKLLDSSATADATGTLFSALTPEYASPEQIKGEVTTTAADVYSLGVVLYELVTGSRLYTLKRRTTPEVLRAVCEQEARLPSGVIGEQDADRPESTTRVAEIEGGAEKLRRRLRGDLDQIILKALRKEPEARYATAEAFSADIGRHLEGLPVMARRRTFLYSAAKFGRRHRATIIAAALVLLTLLGGIVATAWQARIAIQQRMAAQKRFEDVRKLAHTVLFDYHDAIAALPGSTPVRQRLVTDALTYLNGMSNDAGGDVDLQLEIAAAYLRVGDVQGRPYTPNLGQTEPALASYRKALAILQGIVYRNPGNDPARRQMANAYEAIGGVEWREHRFAEAVSNQRLALGLREKLSALHPSDAGIRRELASSHLSLGDALQATCSTARSVPECLRQALEVQRRGLDILLDLSRENPGDLQLRRDIANMYVRIGFRLRDIALTSYDRTTLPQALASQQKAMQIRREIAAADPANSRDRRNVADQHMLLADAQAAVGDLAASIAGYRKSMAMFEVLSAADPLNAEARRDLGFSQMKLAEALAHTGDTAGALRSYHAALQSVTKLLAEDPASAEDRQDLAKVYRESAEAEESTGDFPQAIRFYTGFLGETTPEGYMIYRLGHLNLLAAQSRNTPAAERRHYWQAAHDALLRSLELMSDHGRRKAPIPADRHTWELATRDLALSESALAGQQ